MYIDDVMVVGDTWEEHINCIQALFERVAEAKLNISLVKNEFGKARVVFLGHVIGQGKVQPVLAKVEAVTNFPKPQNKKELMCFLGSAGYYCKFCKNFSDVVTPLTNLKKVMKFKWNDECQEAFTQVKAMLRNAPVLVAPNFQLPFKFMVDTSDVGAGAALLQEDKQGIDHPVIFFFLKN